MYPLPVIANMCKCGNISTANSVCVCVCIPGIYHIMGTKYPYNDSNTSQFWPCGDIV